MPMEGKRMIQSSGSRIRKGNLERNPGMDAFTYVSLIIMAVITMTPILWGLSTSLKEAAEINKFPPVALPSVLDFSSYYKVLFQSNFITYFVNSIVVTVLCVIISTIIAAHAAYAISRFNIRFKNQIMFGILMTSMVPTVALLIPLYILSVKAGLYNTHFLLILIYTSWRTPILTWILKGFFDKSPVEIEEAARVDGCSKLMIFYRIVLPISKAGIISAALLSSVYVWNDFLVSFTFTTKEELRMISIGLYNYITQYGVQWGELMAAVMISIIPIIILFVSMQSKFVEGLAAGAVKG